VISQLSRRTEEVLERVAQFRTCKEIAALHVEAVMVGYHTRVILGKLGRRAQREAARWAREEGWSRADAGDGAQELGKIHRLQANWSLI
jgi:DNA-binding NarL/FixJ family response regulator